jgi:alkylation response protein AidB-like acyl-CoA dehydrogenase
MDLHYAPEDLAFRQATRRWFEANTPRVEPKTLDERKAWHRTMYDAGYIGMLWPREYGGRGATPMQQAIVQDEMAHASAPPPINGLGIGFIGPTIIVHGTEAQKQRYLPKILTAEEIWCQLYSEPNAGSELAGLKTRAEDAGDHFVVNGQKIWTSSGPIADWGILLARTDLKAPKHKGISCVLFNMRQPGVEVRPLKQITGSSLFSEVFMTNARAETSDLIGKLNGGWEIAQTTLGYERGANSLGRVTRYLTAFHQLVKSAKELTRNGKTLIEDPVVRAKLGKVFAELEVQRYAALRVLSALSKGQPIGAASSITKLSYTEFEKRYYEICLEILGPWGQLMSAPDDVVEEVSTSSGEPGTFATAFLWSRAGTIYSGSSEIQKNVIGERVLGLPKEVRADRMK